MKKIKQTSFLTLALLLIISVWFSTPMTALATESNPTNHTGSISSTELYTSPKQQTLPNFSFFTPVRYFSSGSNTFNTSFGSLLNETEKTFYNALCQVTPNDEIIYVPLDHELTEEEFNNIEFQRIAEAFFLDNPQVFWFSTFTISYSYYTLDDITYYYDFVIVPETDYNLYPNSNDLLTETNNHINSLTPDKTNRYETIKDIYTHLCETITYGGNNDRQYTVIGALIDNKAVCEGYAEAFKLLCDSFDIPCICIIGTAGKQNHMWNAVQMEDGNWYLVDTTWDHGSTARYNYFLVGLSTVINGGKFSESHRPTNSHGFDNSLTLVYPEFSDIAFDVSYYDNITVECPHENTIVTNGKEATCTEDGYTASTTCKDCGKTIAASSPIPATNKHAYGAWTTNIAATCTSNGSQQRVCKNCGNTETQSINALGHKTSVINSKAATCTVNGYTGDTYCSTCKQTIAKGSAIAMLGHAYNSGVVTTQPSCTNNGVKTFTCTRCNGTKTEAIAKTGHKAITLNAIAPTCTKTGLTQGSKCSVCNTILSAQQVVGKKAHTEVVIQGKNATCTTQGLTNGKKCSVCGTVTVAQQATAALGHKTSVINAKPATCTVDGYTGDTRCNVCGVITAKGSVIAKIAHKPALVGATQPTFVADGYTGDNKCSTCGVLLTKGTIIPKLVLATPTVAISNTANGINVSWNAITGAQNYIVYRRQYNDSTKKWSGWSKIQVGYTSTNYVDGTVVLGTKYRYTVRAVNGTAMSAYQSTGTLKYNVIPGVTIANAKAGITVKWSKVVNATGYTVYRSQYTNGAWSKWKNMGTAKAVKSAWTDKSVKAGTTYKYTVRACYGKIKSSYAASNTVVFLTQPTVKIANASTGIKVAWTQSAGATGYIVYRSQYVNGAWTKWKNMGTAKANKKSWVDKSVVSDCIYKYTVRAVNGNCKSSYKGTGALTFLTQPTVQATNASNGINVTWNGIVGAQSYNVYRAQYNASTNKWSGWKVIGTPNATQTVWTDTTAQSGITYKYTVRAIDSGYMSSYAASNNVKR